MKPCLYIFGPLDSGKTIIVNLFNCFNEYNIVFGNSENELTMRKDFPLNGNDKRIIMFRDIRVGWLVTMHKFNNHSLSYNMDEYINSYRYYFDYFSKNLEYYLVKYEDVLQDYKSTIIKLFDYLELNYVEYIVDEYKPKIVNCYLTKFDVMKVIKFHSNVSQDDFDYISNQGSDIIKKLNYNEYLTINEVTSKC